MKTAIIILLSSTVALFAADDNAKPVKDPQAARQEIKKLGSVTWDLDTHKLVWVVQKGAMVNGEFSQTSEQRYEISPEEAMMAAAGEQRGLDEDEAVLLHRLLDILSVYCAESVEWWENGEGGSEPSVPANPAKPPQQKTAPSQSPDHKPVRVAEPEPPQHVIPDNQIVARVRV